MTEATEPTTDVTVFRPDLPPLDAAMALIEKSRDQTCFANGMAMGLMSRADVCTEQTLILLRSALDTAIEKQEAATKKIQEFQSIPGSN